MNYMQTVVLLLLISLRMVFPTRMALGVPKVRIEDSKAQLSNVTIS